jgi:hypothetical protein
MAVRFDDFADLIMEIDGVMNYTLVRNDGRVMTHNFVEPEPISSTVLFNGLSCDALKPVMGLTNFRHLICIRDNNEELMVFPIGKYFLGILQGADAYTDDIVAEVSRIIDAVIQDRSLASLNERKK